MASEEPLSPPIRRRVRQLSVEVEQCSPPGGLRCASSADSRGSLERWGCAEDDQDEDLTWPSSAISPTRMMRAVSVRGLESREELGALHERASKHRAARRLQRHKSLALAVWDGHHDLVPHLVRLDSEETSSESGRKRSREGTEMIVAAGAAAEPWLSSVPALSLALIICGCGCQLPYELMNSSDRGCGTLVSACEALFGLVLTAPTALRQESWAVPVSSHLSPA